MPSAPRAPRRSEADCPRIPGGALPNDGSAVDRCALERWADRALTAASLEDVFA